MLVQRLESIQADHENRNRLGRIQMQQGGPNAVVIAPVVGATYIEVVFAKALDKCLRMIECAGSRVLDFVELIRKTNEIMDGMRRGRCKNLGPSGLPVGADHHHGFAVG